MTVNAGVEGQQTQGQPTGDNSQGAGTGQQVQQTQQPQETRAPYADYLEKLPESARGLVEPVFKEWDAGVNQRFQQVHSQYEWAKPWQEIAQNYDTDSVSQALQVLDAINTSPEEFYKAFAEAYGFNAQGGQGQQDPNAQPDGSETDPTVLQLQQQVQQLTDFIMGNHQATQEREEEQQFVQLLTDLQNKHGEYDVDYVLAKVAAGMDPERAVLEYRQRIGAQAQQLNSPGQDAPVVMGSGGGLPTSTVEPKSFDRRQTQDYVASVLGANNRG